MQAKKYYDEIEILVLITTNLKWSSNRPELTFCCWRLHLFFVLVELWVEGHGVTSIWLTCNSV